MEKRKAEAKLKPKAKCKSKQKAKPKAKVETHAAPSNHFEVLDDTQLDEDDGDDGSPMESDDELMGEPTEET